jgi:uncharacterized membrane protein YphA (DoxX/SURF4 family)
MAIHFPGQAQQSAITGQPGSEDEHGASASATRWTLATRIGFRFCFVYFILFSLSNQIIGALDFALLGLNPPKLGLLWPMRQMTFWTASHVFHVTAPIHASPGDSIFGWVQLFCIFAIASITTTIWSLLDRQTENYVALHKWFRLFLRFALALQMFAYGFGKVIPLQMPFPPLDKLVELYGNFSPMAVLWTSMGAAPAYQIFTGSAEVLGGLLLVLPVTTTLGALICAGNMAMVFMLNVAYGVNVKIISSHLLLIALFLLAPDIRSLAKYFFTYRAAAPRSQYQLLKNAHARRIALAFQLLLGAYLAGFQLYGAISHWYEWGGGRQKPALYGIWNVEEMRIDGQLHPPLLTDAGRWHRMIFDAGGNVEIQGMDDSLLYLRPAQKASNLDLSDRGSIPAVGYPGHPGLSGKLAINRPAIDELTLDGSMGGHNIHAELKRVDLRQFTLVSRGFHWVNEFPFQR